MNTFDELAKQIVSLKGVDEHDNVLIELKMPCFKTAECHSETTDVVDPRGETLWHIAHLPEIEVVLSTPQIMLYVDEWSQQQLQPQTGGQIVPPKQKRDLEILNRKVARVLNPTNYIDWTTDYSKIVDNIKIHF